MCACLISVVCWCTNFFFFFFFFETSVSNHIGTQHTHEMLWLRLNVVCCRFLMNFTLSIHNIFELAAHYSEYNSTHIWSGNTNERSAFKSYIVCECEHEPENCNDEKTFGNISQAQLFCSSLLFYFSAIYISTAFLSDAFTQYGQLSRSIFIAYRNGCIVLVHGSLIQFLGFRIVFRFVFRFAVYLACVR